MKRLSQRIILVVIVLLVICSCILLIVRLAPDSPEAEVMNALASLARARDNGAVVYSSDDYGNAESYYDSALTYWKTQNMRFFLLRDYDEVTRLSGLSAAYSEIAIERASQNSSALQLKLGIKISELNEMVGTMSLLFSRFPLENDLRRTISQGNLLLSEGEKAFARGEYIQAEERISEAEPILTSSFRKAGIELEEYFESYFTWKKWVNNTISESKRSGTPAVIVDKFAGKCYLFSGGVVIRSYDAELGRRWVGYKLFQGDNATPEGIYKVTRKLDRAATKYHKALLIDYPNEDDKKRFAMARENGIIPANSRIGGLIEIHGHGGKGFDWTEGCVALENRDMDELFSLVKIGTPVTIVGSTRDLETIKGLH